MKVGGEGGEGGGGGEGREVTITQGISDEGGDTILSYLHHHYSLTLHMPHISHLSSSPPSSIPLPSPFSSHPLPSPFISHPLPPPISSSYLKKLAECDMRNGLV